ncbi:MAG: HNH endonuclease, partial [Oligoflexia bacterium]|nr:HNH endonuclease [Oligoflexia bacterium]
LYVAPGLLEAARGLLDTVALPAQRGCGRIKVKQDYTCQNPECRRRSLRNHVHHDQPRSLGGTDDDDNLRCLCASCHLRLVHGGFMAVERVGDAHVYLYPGRAVVVR